MRADEQTELLFAATAKEWQLFRASYYGWINEHTEDPEYLGYAAHGLGDLSNPFEFQPTFPGPVLRRPTKVEREVARTSDDFVGLMDLAQVQIVQAITLERTCGNVRFPSHAYSDRLFWLANYSALTLLTAAADRLMRLAPPLAPVEGKVTRQTVADRLTLLCQQHPKNAFAIRSFALRDDLAAAINARHALVHKLGSPSGQVTDEHYALLMGDICPNESTDWAAWSPPISSQFDCAAEEIRAIINRLVGGYKAAMEFGNFVLFLAARSKPRRGE